MREPRSTGTGTAIRVLNTALLVGLGASLAVVAPQIRAWIAPGQATVASTTFRPPLPAPIEPPRIRRLSLDPPLAGQGPVSRVINDNWGGLDSCYRSALLHVARVGTGKVTIDATVAFSGRVVHVGMDAPSGLRMLEPCFRQVLSRWAFPPAAKGYEIQIWLLAS